jgi:EpsI family protein
MSRGMRPNRRDLIFGGLAAATSGVAFARMPRKTLMLIGDDQLERIVPHQIGTWQNDANGGVVLPPPDQLAQLTYNQQVARTYVAGDKLPVMFLMAYGNSQTGMLQIHRPEICYPASGFKLSGTSESQWPWTPGHDIPVRRFTARSDTRVEHVMYWTRIGYELPVSWAEQRIAAMRNSLAGYIPDGLLVRISVVSEDAVQANQTIDLFGRMMLSAIGQPGRGKLLGPNF